jgi:hypothetical protein
MQKYPRLIEFGFNLNDFNIVNDTIKKGDTFGTIIEKQTLTENKFLISLLKLKILLT